jgi:hypothetical protein
MLELKRMMGSILDWLRLSGSAGVVVVARERLPFMVMIPLLCVREPKSFGR